MAGPDRHLHPSRLHPARPPGRLRRLVLSLPRLAVRHVGPHPARAGAAQSRGAALRVRLRHQDPDRLTAAVTTSSQGSTMSGHSTYQPQNAFMRWLERRLPIGGLIHSSFVAYPTPRNLNYWWTFGGILAVHAGGADRHRHRAGDALHAACRHGLQFRRAHHARRELRLAAALPALQRRLDVLPRRLHPHVPRHLLRLLQGAARGAVDPRRDPLPADDRDRLHGLRAALGPDELLGRDRHHQPVLGHSGASANRSSPGCGAAMRSAIRRSTASTRCTTCCRS